MSDLGKLSRVGDDWQLQYERRLAHPLDRVWRAVTEPEEMRIWFPTEVVGDRVPGALLRFPFPDQDLPAVDGSVLRYDPTSLFEIAWGEDTVRIELTPDGDATRLLLTVRFAEHGKAARDGAGWHECLDLLEAEVDVRPIWRPGEQWPQLAEVYRSELGPAASTIGPPQGWQPPGT